MFFKQITTQPYDQNCYIIADSATNQGAVIDPGGNGDAILSQIINNQLNIKYIILTHYHFDHIMAVGQIKTLTNAQIVIHRDDAAGLQNPGINMSSVVGRDAVAITPDIRANDGDTLALGDTALTLIHTPGHTPGGMCILADDMLFSGDTLFSLSVGRTDLPGGDYGQLENSIRQKLFTLPEHIKVYPGHDRSSDIGREKRENLYIK